MKTELSEIEINGIKYVPKDSVNDTNAVDCAALPYVIVRAQSAGVFAGYLLEDSDVDNFVILTKVRRLWYWNGASSCSQLATDGVSKPNDCKFTAPNSQIKIKNQIEILPATEKARKSIEGVAVWGA